MSLSAPFGYAYSSAVVSALLAKLLTSNQYKRVLEADSLQDALELFRQTPYRAILEDIEIGEDFGLMFDKAINREVEQRITRILRASPKRAKLFLNSIIEHEEYDVLKSVLRVLIMGADASLAGSKIAPFGRFTLDVCSDIINNGKIEKALEYIRYSSLKKELSSVFMGKIIEKTVFEVDLIFERHHFRKIKKELKKLGGMDKEKMMAILGVEADIGNLISSFRAANLGLALSDAKRYRIPFHRYLPETNLNAIVEAEDLSKAKSSITDIYQDVAIGIRGSDDEFVSSLELSCERYLASKYLGVFTGYRMNIGLIWAYLKLMLYEVSDIRTILIGKMYDIQRSGIENKLILYKLV